MDPTISVNWLTTGRMISNVNFIRLSDYRLAYTHIHSKYISHASTLTCITHTHVRMHAIEHNLGLRYLIPSHLAAPRVYNYANKVPT